MARVFISYKHVEPDQSLAAQLASNLKERHTVFIDSQIPLGQEWGDVIEENLGTADFLTALVSKDSAASPMVVAEIAKAHELNVKRKRPNIIPIRVKFDGQLRYPLSAYINRFQGAIWHDADDTPRITDLVLKTLDTPREKPRRATQREQMLARVRTDWIEGVLQQSLYQVARIDLGLQEEPSLVERGIDALIQRPEESPQPLPAGDRLLTVFDDQLGQLLILGAPGSGKTTLLLELANDLLSRADQDEDHPIPVVFNLSSWAHRPKPLAEWMVDELRVRSDVPKKLAREWIEKDQVLPLLDGLDEVAADHRLGCVEAINAYRADHGFVQVVVCSRISEYQALTTKLRLPAAVLVQPLSKDQIVQYLESAGPAMESVRTALRCEPELWELLSTPLMLSIAALAYKDKPAEAIEASIGPSAERRQQIFAAYVSQMFKRRTKETRFTEPEVRRWLSWLAARMVARAQTTFQIEDIRSSWPAQRDVAVMAASTVTLFLAFLSGSVGWLDIGLIGFVRDSRLSLQDLRDSLISSDAWPYILSFAPIGAVLALIRSRFAAPAEVLSPRWPGTKALLLATAKWAVLGGVLGSIAGAAACGTINGWDSKDGPRWGALVWGRAGAAVFAFGGSVSSMISARVAGVRSSPQAVLHNSLRSSAICFVGAVIVSLPFVHLTTLMNCSDADNLTDKWFCVVLWGFQFLPWMGLFIALEKGGYFLFDHFATRFLLYKKRLIPWHLVRFLDTAAERIFLRKVGGGYIFVHRTLLEYFASQFEKM